MGERDAKRGQAGVALGDLPQARRSRKYRPWCIHNAENVERAAALGCPGCQWQLERRQEEQSK